MCVARHGAISNVKQSLIQKVPTITTQDQWPYYGKPQIKGKEEGEPIAYA